MDGKSNLSTFVESVARRNEGNAELQSIAMKFFLQNDKLQFAMDCAERLVARHAGDARAIIALVRLDKVWGSIESKDKAKHEEKVASFKAVFAKARSDLEARAAKGGLSMEEWAQFLNLCVLSGNKDNSWQAKVVADIKGQKGLRHDTLVRIDKKAAKLGAKDAIKAAAAGAFPSSEYFKQ